MRVLPGAAASAGFLAFLTGCLDADQPGAATTGPLTPAVPRQAPLESAGVSAQPVAPYPSDGKTGALPPVDSGGPDQDTQDEDGVPSGARAGRRRGPVDMAMPVAVPCETRSLECPVAGGAFDSVAQPVSLAPPSPPVAPPPANGPQNPAQSSQETVAAAEVAFTARLFIPPQGSSTAAPPDPPPPIEAVANPHPMSQADGNAGLPPDAVGPVHPDPGAFPVTNAPEQQRNPPPPDAPRAPAAPASSPTVAMRTSAVSAGAENSAPSKASPSPVNAGAAYQTAPAPASPEPAPAGTPAPTPAAAPTAPAVMPDPPQPPPVSHGVSLSLGDGRNSLDIRLAEHAGEVRVVVQTPNHELATSLRSDLPDLVGKLRQSGFQTEVWHPAASSRAENGRRDGPDAGPAQQQWSGNRKDNRQSSQQRQKNQSRWAGQWNATAGQESHL